MPIKPFTAEKASRIWKMDLASAQNVLDRLAERAQHASADPGRYWRGCVGLGDCRLSAEAQRPRCRHDFAGRGGAGGGGGAVYQSVDPDPFSTSGISTSGDSFFGMRALVFESATITNETFLMSVVTAGNDDFFSITDTGVASDLGAMDHKSKGLAFVVPEPSTAATLVTVVCMVISTGSRRRRLS